MVQKSKPRGRPRSYDPDTALDRAAELFWNNGFDETTLDDLSAAMGMRRPSIYLAFGDKEALFLRALERFRATIGATRVLESEPCDDRGADRRTPLGCRSGRRVAS
jgi:AcrR family transcriptional regulator